MVGLGVGVVTAQDEDFVAPDSDAGVEAGVAGAVDDEAVFDEGVEHGGRLAFGELSPQPRGREPSPPLVPSPPVSEYGAGSGPIRERGREEQRAMCVPCTHMAL